MKNKKVIILSTLMLLFQGFLPSDSIKASENYNTAVALLGASLCVPVVSYCTEKYAHNCLETWFKNETQRIDSSADDDNIKKQAKTLLHSLYEDKLNALTRKEPLIEKDLLRYRFPYNENDFEYTTKIIGSTVGCVISSISLWCATISLCGTDILPEDISTTHNFLYASMASSIVSIFLSGSLYYDDLQRIYESNNITRTVFISLDDIETVRGDLISPADSTKTERVITLKYVTNLKFWLFRNTKRTFKEIFIISFEDEDEEFAKIKTAKEQFRNGIIKMLNTKE